MTIQERAFLQAIAAEPDHDQPRLLYADWLEGCGRGPQAEFIRLQCRIAGAAANDPQLPAWLHQQDCLLAVHELEWLGPAAGLRSTGWRRLLTLEWIWCPEPFVIVWQRGLPEWVSAGPTVGDDRLEPLSHLPCLRRLQLSGTQITSRGLAAVARLTGLEELEVSGPRLTNEGLLPLAELPRLRRLNLSGTALDDEGLARLLDGLPALEQLDVSETLVTPKGLHAGLLRRRGVELQNGHDWIAEAATPPNWSRWGQPARDVAAR